jgi:hypothetical protein
MTESPDVLRRESVFVLRLHLCLAACVYPCVSAHSHTAIDLHVKRLAGSQSIILSITSIQ